MDRKKTPWLIVLFHVPWYNSNEAHQDEGDRMLAAMEPLLHAASVDIVLAGHVHAYERTVWYRISFEAEIQGYSLKYLCLDLVSFTI